MWAASPARNTVQAPPRIVAPKITTRPLRTTDLGFHIHDRDCKIRVKRIDTKGAAVRAGMAVGDVVLSIDGRQVEDETDLLLALSRSKPGQEYLFGVRRGAGEHYLILIAPK